MASLVRYNSIIFLPHVPSSKNTFKSTISKHQLPSDSASRQTPLPSARYIAASGLCPGYTIFNCKDSCRFLHVFKHQSIVPHTKPKQYVKLSFLLVHKKCLSYGVALAFPCTAWHRFIIPYPHKALWNITILTYYWNHLKAIMSQYPVNFLGFTVKTNTQYKTYSLVTSLIHEQHYLLHASKRRP